ncbi:phosphotransferase [Sphingomonas sp. RRHST34]|uniref:Phosphotransferase n=1 Tax=Sphingomonas citri TaxID=2862499 RepID=A0ABS7BSB9_9SPHN|nr:aminoglycoside phosphotransferase family protein [Sphingomonas citri]MBW6532514.1 phosphotransferase [Sphingomonas citri]
MSDIEPGRSRVTATLGRLALAAPAEIATVTALSGGVSADVFRVDLHGKPPVCVKFALERLRVAARWTAPLHRAAAEFEWFLFARPTAGAAVPEPLGYDAAGQAVVTRFLPPADFPVWKGELLTGLVDPVFAGAAGAQLAAIHARSAFATDVAARFSNEKDFRRLRTDPYLRATARRHPNLLARLSSLADQLDAARTALVHGDVSPKNILHGPAGPVFIDAECATFGDPAFDIAFLLNHLAIKSALLRLPRATLSMAAAAAWKAYAEGVTWEAVAAIETRVLDLVPALTLARVDGMSPLGYLDEVERVRLRRLGRRLIASPPPGVEALLGAYAT